MILITGPGRSGTSLIARLYQELGFEPGGEWDDSINGGLEPRDIVEVNESILEALGVTPMGSPGGIKKRIRRAGAALLPPRHRSALRNHLRWLPWMRASQPGMLRWRSFSKTVERHLPVCHALAARYQVTKDPRFLWTLPVWAATNAPIEHVLISVRSLDATVDSRLRMDSVRFRSLDALRNSLTYGLGLTLATVEEHRLPYAIVRFPDFVEDADVLYDAMRFPKPVDRDTFHVAFRRIVRPEFVHDRR